MSGRFDPRQLVVSVEHASKALPRELKGMVPQSWLNTHHGWDPGAPEAGRLVAETLGAPLHEGRFTRLVADLNRSANHKRVIPPTTGNRALKENAGLDRQGRQERLASYWYPYRNAVEADLDKAVARYGLAFHLSVHSFTDRLGDEVRHNDFGLLYEAWWPFERPLADRLQQRLAAQGYSVRRNFPYAGRDDGFCMRMRRQRPKRSYIGMEIELNQRICRRPDGARAMGQALLKALEPEFGR